MSRVGGDFGEGGEDEASLVHARVRDGEGGEGEGEGVVEEDVEVDGARGPEGFVGADAAEGAFDGEEEVEECVRTEGGSEGGGGVEVGRLRWRVWEGECGCFVERGGDDESDGGGGGEELEGAGDGFLAVFEVGAEGDVGGVGHVGGVLIRAKGEARADVAQGL